MKPCWNSALIAVIFGKPTWSELRERPHVEQGQSEHGGAVETALGTDCSPHPPALLRGTMYKRMDRRKVGSSSFLVSYCSHLLDVGNELLNSVC